MADSEPTRLILDQKNPTRPIYAEVVYVNAGPHGFKLTFGVLPAHAPDQDIEAKVQPLVTIGMSPEHAKSLHEVLGGSLKTFEERVGPLRPTPDPDSQ